MPSESVAVKVNEEPLIDKLEAAVTRPVAESMEMAASAPVIE